ncbi:MAG: choice-of-anchor tandem repeat GloVer-containing protein [Parafilimonas sp.]
MKKIIFTLGFIIVANILKAQVLYGTTSFGGINNGGAICKLITATNTLNADFSFNAKDGETPGQLKLTQATDGKLYGMTQFGGQSRSGVIFSFNPVDSSYKTLLDFSVTDASEPRGSLMQAKDGKLYGMTAWGGSKGDGVIFSYDLSTSTYTKLKDFKQADGKHPYGSLIQAADGKLYGMANKGGSNNYGVIFSYDPVTSAYTNLKEFDSKDGANPEGSLVQTADGILYGMTSFGGAGNHGVIFSFDPVTLAYTKLFAFNGINGDFPEGSLMQATDNKLYGMAYDGGSNNYGVIFSFDPVTKLYSKLKDFDRVNGGLPFGDLFQASDGKLYGMAGGGTTRLGVIFSFNPVNSLYTELRDFDNINGREPEGSFMQASDKKLYAVTTDGGVKDNGVIFSYDINTSAYVKLHDFATNSIGNSSYGSLITNQKTKLYGMTYDGGIYGNGTIFSYDASTSVYNKLKAFDLTNGGKPTGRLLLANNGKLYGMTNYGGAKYVGVIFSYDTAAAIYTKLFDFPSTASSNGSGFIQASDGKLYGTTFNTIFSFNPETSVYKTLANFNDVNGSEARGTLVQAADGKLYGMTESGGSNNAGVIFSFNPVTSAYKKLFDFSDDGSYPFGSLIQASDGKLYGMTELGGVNNKGVVFSFDPVTLFYTKLLDFNGANGSTPLGSLMQASDDKLYGMTNFGGSNNAGVAFSYDITTSTYTKLSDFTGNNGSGPEYTSFTELPDNAAIQISINNKSITEGNDGKKILQVPVVLNVKSHNSTILVHYHTQNITAIAGSDYIAQSGKLAFPPNIKKILLPIRIIGDKTLEADETFKVVLNNSVNASIADSAGVFTILNDDGASANMALQATTKTTSVNLSPNPAKDKIQILLSGYEGNILIQLSNNSGQILQQIKLQTSSAKLMQQQININDYANGTYLITAIDEKGNRQTKQLIINR